MAAFCRALAKFNPDFSDWLIFLNLFLSSRRWKPSDRTDPLLHSRFTKLSFSLSCTLAQCTIEGSVVTNTGYDIDVN